jgi:predicted nucleic acid-binding protein
VSLTAPSRPVVVLDTSPLSILAERPGKSQEVIDCHAWFASVQRSGATIYLPEIADYELRRELRRAGQEASVIRLNELKHTIHYVPITTATMLLAADLWAMVRRQGRPTAPDLSLDADVILAAQALTLGNPDLVIATSNPGHLARFITAMPWRQIGR